LCFTYEDFVNIKENLSGKERAEWIIEQIDGFGIEKDERALKELEDLLESGYQSHKLYLFLVIIYADVMFNYGNALKLIDEALEKFRDDEDSVQEFLSEKINLLLQMKKYNEAVEVINKLRRMGKSPNIVLDENDLLIRIALRHGMKYREVSNEAVFATFFMLYLSRRPTGYYKKIEAENSDFQYPKNQLARLDNEIPGLLNNLKELVREDDFWAVINNDQDFSWSVLFGGISD
jgi:hypothetical protein